MTPGGNERGEGNAKLKSPGKIRRAGNHSYSSAEKNIIKVYILRCYEHEPDVLLGWAVTSRP